MLQKNFKLSVLIITLIISVVTLVPAQTHAQTTPTQQDLQDIQTGQALYTKLQNQQLTCKDLKNDDFEKIGEYVMDQRFGNTQSHIQMNNNMKQMMGDQSEENMNIKLGMIATGCNTSLSTKGGVPNMMDWGYGYGNMMNGSFGWGFSILGSLFWLVAFIDLILLGIWLWKKIQK